jgi:hypothetical protein
MDSPMRARQREQPVRAGLLARLFRPLAVKIPLQALALVLIAGIVFYVQRDMEPRQSGMEQAALAPEVRQEAAPAARPPEARPHDRRARVPARTLKRQAHEASGAFATPKAAPAPATPPPLEDKAPGTAARADSAAPNATIAPFPAPVRGGSQAREKAAGAIPAPAPPPGSAPEKERAAPRAEEGAFFNAPEGSDAAGAPPGALRAMGEPPAQEAGKKAAVPSRERAVDSTSRGVALTLRVGDLAAGAGQVDDLLRRAGARRVTRRMGEGSRSFTAEVPAGRAAALVERLAAVGVMEPRAYELPPGAVPLRIPLVEGR